MKILIAEDDFTSRIFLQEVLKKLGQVHVAVNGKEAVDAATAALDAGEPYDLICLDVMMPEMDGHEALKHIRRTEESRGIMFSRGATVVMTTALDHIHDIMQAFYGLCDGYLSKPISKGRVLEKLRELDLLGPETASVAGM
jgi:two-component system chemotaxis response regulator CheY